MVASLSTSPTGEVVATWSEWLGRRHPQGYGVTLRTFSDTADALRWIEQCAEGRDFRWHDHLVQHDAGTPDGGETSRYIGPQRVH